MQFDIYLVDGHIGICYALKELKAHAYVKIIAYLVRMGK